VRRSENPSSTRAADVIDRSARIIVVASLLAALALQVSLVARGTPSIGIASLIAFVAALGGSVAFPRLGPALVLSLTYVAPAAIASAGDSRDSAYLCVWLAALIGPVVPAVASGEWRFPRAWRWPLMFWLLCIAAVWPLIVLRECNFDPQQLLADTANSSIGIPPSIEALGITQAALTLGLPLLWLDWLFGAFETDRLKQLTRWVIAPLTVSWLLCAAAGVYQGFVNMLFLNGGLFGYMGRASGMMVDANPFGVVSAMWGAALFSIGAGSNRRWGIAGGAAALLLSWVAVWASGSRTAIVTAAIALMFVGWYGVRAVRVRRTRAWVLGGSAAVLVAAVLLVALAPSTEISGFSRLRGTFPSPSVVSVRAFAAEMWNRNHYGEASTKMIREFPLVGVGLGAFPTLAVDYGRAPNGDWLTPDNAQNWYRHQLAEMGIVGSLGWIFWIGLLGAFFWRTSRRDAAAEHRVEAGAIVGALVGVALVSLVGMPTANTAAALTLMVFVFWYSAIVDPNGRVLPSRSTPSRQTLTRSALTSRGLVIALPIVLFLAGTAFVGWTRLRPPQRALRFGWEYVSGFYDFERLPGQAPFRWTTRHAVDVFPIANRYLRLRYWVNPPDVERRPMGVKIWLQNRLVVDASLRSVTPVTEYVQAPAGEQRLMLEARVSRTWKPSDYGQADTRDIGVAFEEWTFVSDPPPGATIVSANFSSPQR
jgi:hypothetical protein